MCGGMKAPQVEERRCTSADGTEIAYHVVGEGPPVLLCNGLGGSWMAWTHQIRYFEDRYRFISWDYRGLYRSGPPSTPDALRIVDHTMDALAVLEAEGVERAAFVGWSMGVQVSLEAALQAPERVERLVLINGTHGNVFDTGFQPLVRFPRLRRVMHGLVEHLSNESLTLRALRGWTLWEPNLKVGGSVAALWAWNRRVEDMYRQYVNDVMGHSLINFLRLFQHLDAHSVYPLLPEVIQPTLVISGGVDYLTPPSMSREIAKRIPRAEHLHIRRASHFVLLEYPERVLRRIEDFLR